MDSERDSRSEQGRRCRDSARLLRTTGTGRTSDRPARDRPTAVRRLPRTAAAGAEHARSIGASEEPVGRRLGTHRRRGALTGKLPPRRDIPPLPPVRAASGSAAYGASGQA